MDQAGSVAGGEVGPDAKQNGADWRDTSRVRPAQIVPRHTQGWVLVHHLSFGNSVSAYKSKTNSVYSVWNQLLGMYLG